MLGTNETRLFHAQVLHQDNTTFAQVYHFRRRENDILGQSQKEGHAKSRLVDVHFFNMIVSFKDVKKLEIGQKTALFTKNPNKELEALSFSLVYGNNKTLDIIAKEKKEYNIWTQGIEFLLANKQDIKIGMASENTTVNLDIDQEKKKIKEQFEQIGDAYSWGQNEKGACTFLV